MLYEPDTVKGFADIFPPESQKREAIVRIIQDAFQSFGFSPLETPIVEFDELMRSDTLDTEDDAISDRFRLKDKGGRNLGLRYEFTFQLARIFKQNPTIKLPFRRYQIGPVFRDEPVGPGRFRQFTQCDADIIGDTSIESDAEIIALTANIFDKLGIDVTIQVNNRKLLNAILESVQITEKNNVMRELDKLDKIGEDAVKANLKKYAETNQIITLFKLLEKDSAFFTKNLFEGAQEIEQLEKLGKEYDFKVAFTPTMIRGLTYYTGTIFEVKTKGKKETIAAGGRYDNTVGKYLGRQVPAIGISFGLERIADIAEVTTQSTQAVVISLKQDPQTIGLTQKMRKNDISCIPFFGKPGKALEYANSLEIPYAIFIGEEELAKKKYKLKDMKSGDEELLTEKQLITKLQKNSKIE